MRIISKKCTTWTKNFVINLKIKGHEAITTRVFHQKQRAEIYCDRFSLSVIFQQMKIPCFFNSIEKLNTDIYYCFMDAAVLLMRIIMHCLWIYLKMQSKLMKIYKSFGAFSIAQLCSLLTLKHEWESEAVVSATKYNMSIKKISNN